MTEQLVATEPRTGTPNGAPSPADSPGRPASWPPPRIPFAKMNGSGNDFVVIDNRNVVISAEHEVAFTRAVCDRRRSIGADGVVLLEHPGESDDAIPVAFAWRYRNADGSEGAFCGNGAMCAARYAVLHGIADARHVFTTPSGIVLAAVSETPGDPRVAIDVNRPSAVSPARTLAVGGTTITAHDLTVGAPHAVTVVRDIDRTFAAGPDAPDAFIGVGREVRHHVTSGPQGTNLDAIEVRADNTVLMRTYERGVEDETLACGSGAIASAIVATALGLTTAPVTVITRGGEPLVVSFTWDVGAQRADQVVLTGQARYVAVGELTPDALAAGLSTPAR